MSEIRITLPDGSERAYPEGATGADVATSIGSRLAKAAVAATGGRRRVGPGRPLPRRRARVDHHRRHRSRPPRPAPLDRARHGPGGHPALPRGQVLDRPGHRGRLLLRLRPAGRPDLLRRRPGGHRVPHAARSSPPTSPSSATSCEPTAALELFADQPYKRRDHRAGAGGRRRRRRRRRGRAPASTISVYRNTPEFVDLCRGPHVPSTGRLGPSS